MGLMLNYIYAMAQRDKSEYKKYKDKNHVYGNVFGIDYSFPSLYQVQYDKSPNTGSPSGYFVEDFIKPYLAKYLNPFSEHLQNINDEEGIRHFKYEGPELNFLRDENVPKDKKKQILEENLPYRGSRSLVDTWMHYSPSKYHKMSSQMFAESLSDPQLRQELNDQFPDIKPPISEEDQPLNHIMAAMLAKYLKGLQQFKDDNKNNYIPDIYKYITEFQKDNYDTNGYMREAKHILLECLRNLPLFEK